MQNEDYHMMSGSNMNYSDNAKKGLTSSFQRILYGARGEVLIDIAPDNNLKSSGIKAGDGIVIDTGSKKPTTGGGYYLIEYDGGYRQLVALMHTGVKDTLSPDETQVLGKVIGTVAVDKL